MPTSVSFLIACLLASLAGPSYRERELARSCLVRLEPLARIHLERASNSPVLEVRTAAANICLTGDVRRMNALLQRADAMRPTRWPVLPWVDMAPYDQEISGLVWDCLDRARAAVSKDGPPDWPRHREGTRLLIIELIRRGWSERRIVALLDAMAEREGEWIDRCGNNYNPPVIRPQPKGQ